MYELGADSSADDRSAKHVTVSYIDAGRWIHGRTLRARRRNFCSVISEFALPQVAHSQGPPPECSLLICRSLARTTRHARHVTHDTSRTARHGHAKFPVGGHPLRSCITPPTSDLNQACLEGTRVHCVIMSNRHMFGLPFASYSSKHIIQARLPSGLIAVALLHTKLNSKAA